MEKKRRRLRLDGVFPVTIENDDVYHVERTPCEILT
jgi:hypothetical protein